MLHPSLLRKSLKKILSGNVTSECGVRGNVASGGGVRGDCGVKEGLGVRECGVRRRRQGGMWRQGGGRRQGIWRQEAASGGNEASGGMWRQGRWRHQGGELGVRMRLQLQPESETPWAPSLKIYMNGGVTTRNGCSFTKESIVWIYNRNRYTQQR